MDKIKHNIRLDLADGGSQDAIYARQADTSAHVINIQLRTNGKVYRLADDVVANIRGMREDGTIIYNACTIEDNTLRTELTTQMLAVAGRTECVLELIGTEPAVLTTPGFDIIVERVNSSDNDIIGTNELSALVAQTAETKALQMEIERKLAAGEFDGEEGYSPEVTVTPIENGYRLDVQNKNTQYSVDIIEPEQGVGIESAVLNADYTLTLNFTDGSKYTTPSIRGEKGEPGIGLPGTPGKDGDDGVSPEVSVAQITNGNRITIVDAYGTKSFDVLNGSNGITPAFSIGTVTTLAAGSNATASIGGTVEKPVLNLGIPKGADGKDGEDAEGGGGDSDVFVGLYTDNFQAGETATTYEEWLAAYQSGKVCIMRNNMRRVDEGTETVDAWRIALLQDAEPYTYEGVDWGVTLRFVAPTHYGVQVEYISANGWTRGDTLHFANAQTTPQLKLIVAVPTGENDQYMLMDAATESPITFDDITENLVSWVIYIADAITFQFFTLGGMSDTPYFTSLSVDTTTGALVFRLLNAERTSSEPYAHIYTYTLGSIT